MTTTDTTPIAPPFDPELVPVLEMIDGLMPRVSVAGLDAAREVLANGIPGVPEIDLTAQGRIRVEERAVPGPVGDPDITVLILSPAAAGTGRPAIYHTHGGGMVMGDRRSQAELFLPYVLDLGAVVVSVEYRLAPEHPDPAPVEDCYAGLVWTAAHADELGIDPTRILIAGASAGGGLAAGTALLARDRGGPVLTHQVLICPMIDDRFETPSSQMLDGVGVWDRTDLSGLPRTYLDCGSAETFRDETLAYAQRLSEAGVSVDLHMWGGAFHGFDLMAAHTALAQASAGVRDEFIRRALAG